MLLQRTGTFSKDEKYFACLSSDNKLFVWEICSDTAVIDCKFDSKVYGSCTSLLWIPLQHKNPSPKKARLTRSQTHENQLLAISTSKGDIIVYNVSANNLQSHLRARHSDSINCLSFCCETNSFFTCSSDKSIAVWDITSGRQKSKWIASDDPVCSICLLDSNNLLSANRSVLWWSISEKQIIKKFAGHSTEIFQILPVNADLSLKSCYFLTAALEDSKINAWSLNSSNLEIPVASFVPSGTPQYIDISRISSKDNPLLLTVITKEGQLDIFMHTLNGNISQPLYPKTSIDITTNPKAPDPKEAIIICTKLSIDSESCIIAHGSSKKTMSFKHFKIKQPTNDEYCEQTSVSNCAEEMMSPQKISRKLSINGVTSPEKSTTAVKLKHSTSSPQKKKKTSITESSYKQTKVTNCELPTENIEPEVSDMDIANSNCSVSMLLKALRKQDKGLIDIVFHCGDTELICSCIESLPLHSLKQVIEELTNRFTHSHKSFPTLGKWLKEILRIHLKYLIENQDMLKTLNCIKETIEAKRIQETVSKMSTLRGLLSLQNASSEESNSDSESSIES